MTGKPLGFTHPEIQRLRRLAGRRSARRAEGAFVIEGPTLIREALRAGWPIERIVVTEGIDVTEMFDAGATPLSVVTDDVIERVATTQEPQGGVIAIASMPSRSLRDLGELTFVVVCDGLADPGNLGTIIRSAEAAGAHAVALTAATVDPYSPKAVRASAGALFHVPVVVDVSLSELRAAGLALVGTSSHASTSFRVHDFRAPTAIVMGNEAHGLSADEALDAVVAIPHVGRAESLNVSMATTLLCFEVARQRG